ncbi:DUF448 domain-containing protein [Desulfurobacterium atlanticum]|uniref:YlxR domain-containing protein n=1 Tax=Desulfurobacterium atlanticum TaxID=240169 RepID=A0A238ZHD4_9BACT|nr:DUF448 domain-containing protein [Desulfurobacterium atlanticum]SNR82579.1 hypothetical protein SAMN06265340_10880 [Desulfurobacterium atlanticum]
MQKNKMPERVCAACRKKGEKEEFIRFVEFNGLPVPDIKNRLPGRGFNVCPSKKCISIFIKKRFGKEVNQDKVIEETVKQLQNYALSLLSIAHKSRNTVIGQDNVKNLKKRSGTLILASDLSDKTAVSLEKSFKNSFRLPFNKEELGKVIKKDSQIGVIYIKPCGIEEKLKRTLQKLKQIEKT